MSMQEYDVMSRAGSRQNQIAAQVLIELNGVDFDFDVMDGTARSAAASPQVIDVQKSVDVIEHITLTGDEVIRDEEVMPVFTTGSMKAVKDE